MLVKVIPVSLSWSIFSWTISFLYPPPFFFFSFSSFLLSHGVLSPPLSTSPASESFCPLIMLMDLGFVKLLPSILLSSFSLKLTPHLYSTIWFHPLFAIILIVPFCLLSYFLLLFYYIAYPHRFHPLLVTITVTTLYWMWQHFTHSPVSWPLSSSFHLLLYMVRLKTNLPTSTTPNPLLLYKCVLGLLGKFSVSSRKLLSCFCATPAYYPFFVCRDLVANQFALHSRFTL